MTVPVDPQLEAHIRFEMARYAADRLEATIGEEVDALLAWLETVSLADLLPAEPTANTVGAMIDDLTVTDELVGLVADLLLAGREALAEDPATVADLADPADLHALIDLTSEMTDLRGALVRAVTDNPAYHELVAHVLYQGVKAFMLSENVLARKLPGAQSLIRLGQRSLSSAAPGLEESVDRQLSRFVQTQIGTTLSDSRRFLEESLSGESAHELLDTMLRTSGRTRVGEIADVISPEELESLTVAAEPLVSHLLRSGILARLLTPVVEQVLTAYADCEVRALLTDLGLDRDAVVADLSRLATPAVQTALATGFLEERIRARLTEFYGTWHSADR